MTAVAHLERVTEAPDDDTAAALLALEAATQDLPLGLDGLLREAQPDGVLVIARDGASGGARGGALLGFASARLLADDAHVMRLAVDVAQRRRGVGRALLAELIGWAGEVGASALLLEVRAGNGAALGLYAAAGLAAEGRRRGYYPDGEDALLLRRRLGGR